MFHEPSLDPRADITRPFLPPGDAQAVCHGVHRSGSERVSVGLQIETVTLFPPCNFHQGCKGHDVGRAAEEPRDRCTNLQNQADASTRFSSYPSTPAAAVAGRSQQARHFEAQISQRIFRVFAEVPISSLSSAECSSSHCSCSRMNGRIRRLYGQFRLGTARCGGTRLCFQCGPFPLCCC
jgi:hypothetical protein